MARFRDNPLKQTPAGNEFIPATDPSTGDDVSFTPLIITQFVATNMALANGSTNGLIDPAALAKLNALDTQAETDIRVAQLAEVSIPVFFGTPADGTFTIYQHCLDVSWMLALGYFLCSAGSTNVSVTKNGVAIAGLTNIPITTAASHFSVSGGSANYTYSLGDTLGLSFTGTTGNCRNAAISLKANSIISP